MNDDLPARLAAKLVEVKKVSLGLEGLLVEAAMAGLTGRATAPQLTPREHEILHMIADGLTNQEIADRLGLSHHTVKDQASSLYRRLKVKNRASAIARGREAGLLLLAALAQQLGGELDGAAADPRDR